MAPEQSRVLCFFKTIPGIITGVAASVGVIIGFFTWAAATATAPLAERVSAIEQQQSENAAGIQHSLEFISQTKDELRADLLKIIIADMIDRDLGKGERREYILFNYDELLKICDECPSTKYEIERYLASLK